MAATRIFSTAAYLCAGVIALILSLLPKFGEISRNIPPGVLGGGEPPVLYRNDRNAGRYVIWVENKSIFPIPGQPQHGNGRHL